MRYLATALFLGGTLFAALDGPRAGVDPRIELMSIIFRLSGANEYTGGRIPSYNEAIDRHFAPYRDHEVVRLAKELRSKDSVAYDAIMNLAVNVKDVQSLAERVPFDSPSSKLDRRWQGVKARAFLETARKFVADSHFLDFVASQKTIFDLTDERLRSFIASNADLAWFDKFFGTPPGARFVIVPGLTNGGNSYGASLVAEDGVEEIYAIPGVWQIDAAGQPTFPTQWVETLVHEFAHSYANPLVEKFESRFEKSGQVINASVESAMRAQGYGPWKTMVFESLVRASTICYVRDHQGKQAAERAIQSESGRSFLWAGDLAHVLETYAQDRKRYPTLESFMPKVIEFFDALAPKINETVQAFEASRPKVVSMVFENGAQNVDPDLKAIEIRFDRAMRKTDHAVMQTNPARYPKTGTVSFDETGKVFTIPVALEPEHDYEFGLNWPGGGSFVSNEGVPLKFVRVWFRTRASAPPK